VPAQPQGMYTLSITSTFIQFIACYIFWLLWKTIVMYVIYELCMYLNSLLILVILIIVHLEFHLEILML
jgi:hypothetical protein